MPDEIVYENAPWGEAYRNRYPDDHTDACCREVLCPAEIPEPRCGLPAWSGAGEPEPRCEFHAERSPGDIRERLETALEVSQRKVHLQQARLEGAMLWSAHLERANLSYAHLEGARLRGARLEGADLRYADLEGARLREAHLEGAKLCGALLGKHVVRADGVARTTTTDLRGADLRGAWSWGVTWPYCVVVDENTRFGPTPDGEDRDVVRDGDAAVYRQLKLCFQESGLYDRAGGFFFHERRALQAERLGLEYSPPPPPHPWPERLAWLSPRRAWAWATALDAKLRALTVPGLLSARKGRQAWRAQATHQPTKRMAWRERLQRLRARLRLRNLQDSALYHLCGFGERPSWVAWWALRFILFFAVAQTICGLRNYGTGEVVGPWALGYGSTGGLWLGLLKGLYFSAVTFVTLGYGDFAPMSGWGRLLASAEAFLGIGFTSLFMICLVRKFGR
jgi:hypothetical protein